MKRKDEMRVKTCLPGRDDDTERPSQINKNNLPIDRGWAWVVVTAVFFMNLIHVGMYRCYGILFVEFLKEFNASASVTSLVVGIYSASYSLTSLFALNILIQKFTLRTICIIGILMMSLGGVLSYFAMNLEFLMFSQSFLPGAGSALLFGPCIAIVGQYFEKRRALAQAIGSCGVSLGGMVVPQLIRYLLSEYDLRGTLLISGGLFSEILVFALLCRPPPRRLPEEEEEEEEFENLALERFKKKIISQDEFEIVSIESYNDSVSQISLNKTDDAYEMSNGHLEQDVSPQPPPNISVAKMIMQRREPFRSRTGSDPTRHSHKPGFLQSLSVPKDSFLSSDSIDEMGNSNTNIAGSNRTLKTSQKDVNSSNAHLSPRRQRKNTSHSYLGGFMDTLSQSSYLKYASNADIHMLSTFSLNNPSVYPEEETIHPEKEISCCRKVMNLFDFSVFRIPHFYLIIAQNMFGVCAISLFAAFLPATAEEIGLSDVQGALLITIYAGVDFVSRFLSGVIVDAGKVKSHYLLAVSMMALGVLYNLTRFYTSMNLMIMYSALFGLFSGGMPSLNPVVMIDFLGNDNLPKALGFVQVFHGVTLAGITPLIGALRDITGNYHASYHLLGTFSILAGAVLFLEPLARKLRDDKQDKASAEEVKALKGIPVDSG